MNLKILFLFVIYFWACTSTVCYAFLDRDVHLLNMQNGLADNTVSSIYKDSKGFMWFGTHSGLSRYDGRQVTNFELEDKSFDISDIKEVFEGVLSFINNGMLYAFDLRKECFMPVVSSSGEVVRTKAVLQKNDSLLFAISGKELLVMKKETSAGNELRLDLATTYSGWLDDLGTLVAMAYSYDKEKLCLIDDRNRLILLDTETLETLKVADVGINRTIWINSVLYDEDCVWILTVGDGIIHYNTRTGKCINLTYSPLPVSNRLSHTDVFAVTRLNENKYLAVTWNGYTLLTKDPVDADKISTEVYSNSSSLMHRNLETRMIAAYYDSQGVLWLGTNGGGVIWSDLRMQFYDRFYQDRHNEICSIMADDDGYIWLATFHKGIMRSRKPFDALNRLDFVPVGTEEVRKQSTVLCGLKDETGDLWFGNQDGTLTHYHRQTGTFNVLPLVMAGGLVNKASVWTLFIDSRKRFWIGTSKGLLSLNRESRCCNYYHFTSEQVKKTDPLYIRAIAETADHALWLGTSNYGICKMVGDTVFQAGYECSLGISNASVRSLLASSDGNLYIGYMNGLGVLSPQKDKITGFYTIRDGLCSNFIGCITEDGGQQIWVGSNSGISRYSRHQHLFYNYYISGSNRSVLRLNDVLFWGNNRNLTYFVPGDINAFVSSEKVVITGLEVNNKPVGIGKEINGQVILERSIFYTPAVRLNYENRNFSLTFNNLSYSEGQQKYSYRLRPYQHDWLIANGNEKVSYANLPAGTYTFEVKNMYPDERMDEVTSLEVEILPHWSETWLFHLLVVVTVFLMIYAVIYRVRLRQKRLKHELQLEHEVFTATVERDKEKQIRMERENFFTNAAHELRTPLTLILSPLQELLHAVKSSDFIYEKLSVIYKNASSLHTLVDHLLYVQKIEAGMVKLSISNTDIVKLVREVVDSFRPMADAKGFRFVAELPREPVRLWIDVEKITSALRNILSNAFKYTSPDGTVSLNVERVEMDGYRFCSLLVSDTGKGIPEELQERVFDSFITGENTPLLSTKVGIGLRIVKNTMDLHHGTVTLKSKPGQGTTFTLLIPEGREHFSEDDYEVVSAPAGHGGTAFFPSCPAVREEQTIHKKSLLVIEDNLEIRTYIRSLFRKDYTVYEAADGEEGVQSAVKNLPDLIISDIMMPVKDGFACCREIREQPRTAHIPILMLTAKAEDADILQASKAGADDYMMKPFNPEILKSKVTGLILQRERLKRIYTKTLMLRRHETPDERKEEEMDNFVRQVVQVIEAHLADETFNVKTLAEQLNMSQPTLYRKIRQRSELNAIDMIRSVRMSKAASLIMENRYTIQEIAEMVGYSDTRTLRKHFMEQFGVSPSKYMDKE